MIQHGSSATDSKGRLVAVAVLVGILLLVFAPHLGNGFVYDDHAQIEHDPYVRGATAWTEAFTQDVWGNLRGEAGVGNQYYRPLFLVLNRVLAAAGGGSPFPFHLAGMFLHLACVGAAFVLLRRLLDSWWSAFAATTLFALHPAVGETVFWAAVLPEQLVLLGCLSATLCLTAAGSESGARRVTLVVGATLCTSVALLSKETAIVIAPILTLEALRHPPGSRRARLVSTLPLWAAALALLAVRSAVVAEPAGGFAGWSLDRLGRAGWALAWDARHLAFPYPLSPFHDFRWLQETGWQVAPGTLVLAGLAALAVWTARTRPACLYWLGWVVLPLLPRLVQLFMERRTPVVVSERYLLLSLVPWCAGAAVLGAAALQRWVKPESRMRAAAGALCAVALVGAFTLSRYGGAFESDRTYFAHAGERTTTHPVVLIGLAIHANEDGRHDLALKLLDRATAVAPGLTHLHLNRGAALVGLGRTDLAIEAYRTALGIDGSLVGAHLALATALRNEGRLDEARPHYEAELRVDPRSVAARVDLGTFHYLDGDVHGSIAHWSAALDDAPNHPVLLFNLGMAHRALGDSATAAPFLQRFLALPDPGFDAQRGTAEQWLAE